MGNWAELPEDLLILTARRMSLFEDFLSFSGVCRSWRFVSINENFRGSEQMPWLMLTDKDKQDERQFVSLRKGGIIRTINLPEVRGKRCLETLGWLVTISEDGDINLLQPFTRVQISLPNITTFKNYHLWKTSSNLSCIHKAVLSSRPEESKDYVLVVIYGCERRLAFCRPKDKSWTDVFPEVSFWIAYPDELYNSFCDVIFYKGQCRGVKSDANYSQVFNFNGRGHNCYNGVWHINLKLREYIGHSWLRLQYIVQSAEVYLLVIRILREACLPGFSEDAHFVVNGESKVYYETLGFEVFEVDLSGEECVEKTSLGDNALFLGNNSSVSVDASRLRGIKSNCIYYTDNMNRAGNIMGIYNMEDGSLRPCYEGEFCSLACPPMWVNPSSF